MSAARRLLIAVGAGGAGFTVPLVTDYYALFNGQDGDGEYHVFEATTTDVGVTWSEGDIPVLSASGSDWVSDHVKDPWPMPGGLSGYVSGYDGSAYRIGRISRASTAAAWDYDDDTTPTVDLGSSGQNDDERVLFPVVVEDTSASDPDWRFLMWYTGLKASDGRYRILLASSPDGETFTKRGTVLNVGSGGTWDDEGVVSTVVVRQGNTGYLFYGGTSDPDGNFLWQGGLATFDWDDPTGTYTKDAGNPVLTNRNTQDPDTSQDVEVTSGSTNATVEDSSKYNVGEPIVLADNNSTVQVTSIAAIPDGTHVTLADNAAATYSAASNDGRVRPFAYLSVQPRAVFRFGSTWVMLFVPFQPVADLTVVGNTLWEGSMRATASSLTGPWTYDYDAGLLIPLTGDHAVSAENMAAIPTP